MLRRDAFAVGGEAAIALGSLPEASGFLAFSLGRVNRADRAGSKRTNAGPRIESAASA